MSTYTYVPPTDREKRKNRKKEGPAVVDIEWRGMANEEKLWAYRFMMVGKAYRQLQVMEVARRHGYVARCRCTCGEIVEVHCWKILNGVQSSCGCYRREIGDRSRQHGHARRSGRSPEYTAWHGMRQRCLNPRNKDYKSYGERGVEICEEWVGSFERFLQDMGECPGEGYTLDRVDVGKGYYKENCRWVLRSVQNVNQRRNRYLTLHGVTKTISEWAKILGTTYCKIQLRLDYGMSVEEALKSDAEGLKRWRKTNVKAKCRRGENHPRRILSEVQVREILLELKNGATHRELGDRYGVHYTTVYGIASRRTWARVAEEMEREGIL